MKTRTTLVYGQQTVTFKVPRQVDGTITNTNKATHICATPIINNHTHLLAKDAVTLIIATAILSMTDHQNN